MAHSSLALVPARPTVWEEADLAAGRLPHGFFPTDAAYSLKFSPHNPTPGTGRVGFIPVGPNNYPFYSADVHYKPVLQADGGQLSEWQPMYAPSKEQADADRAAAYAAGVPHGFLPAGQAPSKEQDGPLLRLTVVSELHDASSYGATVTPDGSRSGGPFTISVSPKIRVEALRSVIRDAGGILPALQRLSYAGKRLDDAQRTLEQCGVAFWHARFPHWPIVIRRF